MTTATSSLLFFYLSTLSSIVYARTTVRWPQRIWNLETGLSWNTAAAAAAAKSLQSCPTLRNPIDGSSPGSPIPGILQARILEWVAISFSNV